MPIGYLGSTITLTAVYEHWTGAAVTPGDPRISIIDPNSVVVVAPTTPDYAGITGHYRFNFYVPVSGPTGNWTAVWTGIIDGEPTESCEVFEVLEAREICAPTWATPEQFTEQHPEVSEADALDVLIEATWLLSGLVNDQYHQAECWADQYQYHPGLCKIELRHQPVETVFSVTRLDPNTGSETQIEGWKKLAGGAIRICCHGNSMWLRGGWGWGDGRDGWGSSPCAECDDSVIRVQYHTRDNLPPGVDRQVLKLAWEFWKSGQGKACALPERVTNVSREGVSWTVLDPLDFLDKGLTGIGSVDQWISRVNLRGWAGLIDPLIHPRIMLSELTGCGPACTGTAT